MPFHRTDDQMHSHPKARRAGLQAMGLWIVSASHSMAYKGDGFVPDWFVASWGAQSKKLADALVSADLWSPAERNGEKGWQFHDWLDYNPSAEEIERDRERQRIRSREFRRRLREGKKGGDES